jgi:hypothetical protein
VSHSTRQKLPSCNNLQLNSFVNPTSNSYTALAFKNLNFEQANPVIDPEGQFYPNDVTAASALPGWTVDLDTVQQTDVLQNTFTTGQASVDIFGPNFPTTGGAFNIGTIDGKYSVLLQAGNLPGNPSLVGASISQLGSIPPTAQSLEFTAWATSASDFSVSFNGNNLSPVVLGSGPNHTSLYGVNISAYDTQSGTLEFTALFDNSHASALGLDDIAFSPNAVPEPSIVALTAMGGLLFGVRKYFARRC